MCPPQCLLLNEFSVCCGCVGSDSSCLPSDLVPKICSVYGLSCYPTCGCCKKVKDHYPEDSVTGGQLEQKAELMVCNACCIPGLLHTNDYIICPPCSKGLCLMNMLCCCVAEDCTFPPCKNGVPAGCAVYGLACYPTCGCCKTVKDIFPNNVKPKDNFDNVGGAPPLAIADIIEEKMERD